MIAGDETAPMIDCHLLTGISFIQLLIGYGVVCKVSKPLGVGGLTKTLVLSGFWNIFSCILLGCCKPDYVDCPLTTS